MSSEVSIFSGRATKYLAEKIALSYGKKLGDVSYACFSDGEFRPSFDETIRGNEVFIIQSTFPPAENLLELFMMIDAAKRASAKNIIAVIPYFGFARQDRKDKPRVPITSKMIANLLTASGINRLITMDLHADQIQGYFDIPVDHLYASTIFVPYLQSLKLENLTMSSPDTGGTRRAGTYAKYLDADLVICFKQRPKPNQIGNMVVIGDVENKNVILVDDIIDTAGTITKAADLIKSKGAASVRAMCTHPVFSDKACEKIEKSALTEVIVTDTIPLNERAIQCEKINVLSTANLFADVINSVINCESISSHFKFTSLQ
ncbi:MAG: ribose-phosphate pyrophosphokinase [Bacteroidales bacterium]|jgi:ribose-phosphate pyrophosphokinase|nr:ribose-phosphate pyrophosphokinase [Bacteroidales bacterium]MDD4213295.1 ribose-phosphate pyrophosphokinase [Bacteroidales bacterium]